MEKPLPMMATIEASQAIKARSQSLLASLDTVLRLERLLRVEMWDEETYNDVTSAVRKAAQVALNLSVSFKFQEKAKVDIICAKMAHKWSFLNEYEDHWPAKSMLKAYLKYTSECA
ncbi:hypothetical protein PTI98_008966 [Pleurotus ostreatus]|nr:hypothetical protein PTI98_008966 [Pleurotus ostreatus]